MSPALIEAVLEVVRLANAAGHGGKQAVYDEACKYLRMSHSTLMRRIKEVTVKPERKRRSDAGTTNLSLRDAQLLSAAVMEGYRANDKTIHALRKALERLRSNLPHFACTLDPATGEIRPLSDGTCARALRTYRLHPKQLRQPAPVQALASEHPNDVWQIDASISTLFYVPEGGVADMDKAVFYKNKPENFEKIKRQRLTRYVLTDHCSGSIFVHYVAGGESTVNMAESFLAAIAKRPEQQMYGVPFHLMMDPGSAGIGGAFRTLMNRLDVKPVVNEAGNPRAKGQVENAHNLVETDFESGFKFTNVPSIEWINEQAQKWMRYYNTMRTHGRHGLARWAKWMEITQAQLRLVDAELARQLLTHEPATPKVDSGLCVRFNGRVWSVKHEKLKHLQIGDKVAVTFNPFNPATAMVIERDVNGIEVMIEIQEVQRDAHGFAEGAALIGREFKSMPETAADKNRKLIERIATGTDTDEEAAAARKRKALPFGGMLDPYKHHDNLPDVATLPRRGTELQTSVSLQKAPARVLTGFEAAAEVRRMGQEMTREKAALLRDWYPNGVPEDELEALAARLKVRGGLRVVTGGAQ